MLKCWFLNTIFQLKEVGFFGETMHTRAAEGKTENEPGTSCGARK